MQVKMFNFPVNQKKVDEIVTFSAKLIQEQNVRTLEPEERDWLDWANSVLQYTPTKS